MQLRKGSEVDDGTISLDLISGEWKNPRYSLTRRYKIPFYGVFLSIIPTRIVLLFLPAGVVGRSFWEVVLCMRTATTPKLTFQ